MDTKIKSKSKKINLKHQSDSFRRTKEPQISVLMWGVNTILHRCLLVEKHAVMLPDDFKAYTKVKFKNHLLQCGNLPKKFKVKCFFPEVFRNLREKFTISEENYLNCLNIGLLDYLPRTYKKKVYLSLNKTIVFKVISSDYFEVFQSFIQIYHKHIIENRGQTLIPHYTGLYMVTVDGKKTYYLSMVNIFSKYHHCKLKFLIKSKICENKKNKAKAKYQRFIKDVNIIKENLHINLPDPNHLLEKIDVALEFFSENNIDNFSLCVGCYQPFFTPDSKLQEGYIFDSNEEISSDLQTDEEDEEVIDSSKVIDFVPSKDFQFSGTDGQIYFIGFTDIFKKAAILKKPPNKISYESSGSNQRLEYNSFREMLSSLFKSYS